MKNAILILVSVILTGPIYSQLIFEDNFDSYTVNNGLAFQSADWETWSSPSGGNSEDVKVTDGTFNSPNNSVWFTTGHDIIYRLGEKNTGRYQVSFNIYIRNQMGAYLNVEHEFQTNYAFDFWFNENKEIWFKNGTDSLKLSNYTSDAWHQVVLDFDLDKDSVGIVFDSVQLGQFVFSYALAGADLTNVLDVINFFGISYLNPEYGIQISDFFIDDFKYMEVWPLGINEQTINQISVYPNPTSSTVHIDLSLYSNASLVLRNVTGQVIEKFTPIHTSEFSFEINGSSGVYFLEVKSDNQETKVVRVLKE